MEDKLVICSGKRTPFGSNGGTLKDLDPVKLGVISAQAALRQANLDPKRVDHVIWANICYSHPNSNYTARHVGLELGIPEEVPAFSVNRLCGSGFQTVVEAYQQMLAGDTDVALVGGSENMSASPYLVRGTRFGTKMGALPYSDMLTECLTDPREGLPMAITAENLAERYELSKKDCDEFALESQIRFQRAKEAGKFSNEWVSVSVDAGRISVSLTEDEHPREGSTLESLAKLNPLFKKDGTVSAGNASGIVDGSAALVVARESKAKSLGLKPIARLLGYGISGCDPKVMGIGPVPAIRKALSRLSLQISDLDLVEVNEAFAAQALAVQRELKIDSERLNVNGGAIAIGHPIGATGIRIIQTLAYELQRTGKRLGCASACIGGGQGIALILEGVG